MFPDAHKNISKYFKFSFHSQSLGQNVICMALFLKQFNNDSHEVSFIDWLKADKAWKGIEMNTLDFANGCDFIGKFENLQEDFSYICNVVGIAEQELPHTNKTLHKHYAEYYDDQSRRIVEENARKRHRLFWLSILNLSLDIKPNMR